MDTILKTEDLGISFGGLKAVQHVNLNLEEGSLTGLIGPNGAGKTTVFNLLTGVYRPTEGRVLMRKKENFEEIHRLKQHQIVTKGIARTFQNIRLFKDITVLDNVMIGMNHRMHTSLLSSLFRLPVFWKDEVEAEHQALQILDIFDMRPYRFYHAGNLSYGMQRKLEIARALATQPKVLLLDEPAAGMNDTETRELMETIRNIREKLNITILLIEHDMKLVTGICEHIVVLNYGQVISRGAPEEVVHDPEVIRVYLGE